MRAWTALLLRGFLLLLMLSALVGCALRSSPSDKKLASNPERVAPKENTQPQAQPQAQAKDLAQTQTQDQPSKKDGPVYYPLEPGLALQYSNGETNFTRRVYRPVTRGGRTVLPVGSDWSHAYFVYLQDGIIHQVATRDGNGEITYDTPFKLQPANLRVGVTWREPRCWEGPECTYTV